ncbi:PREDICTED: DNA dC-_dU-editing enzyme APOBEC3-like [Elephantulus edwardii]|uniref:DNA dC->dU-editing enzyme APOBEC3-like n=1 Tax=Elephantulus edwardii TaxID=28737 RepID=UPI0003F08815|nr:PREDICTED: DNA dC->dU-editing enzyme APOBEC3-like [Elephantulus edwardii]
MGEFVNEVHETRLHSELLFLLRWWSREWPQQERYLITWYLSWSPCCECAIQVADFLRQHDNLSLHIFVARVYYSRKPEIHCGLHRLWQAGASIEIMSLQDFENCWENFVAHGGQPFQLWRDLNENCKYWNTELTRIRSNTMDLLTREIFYSQFNNQRQRRRRTRPYHARDAYLCFKLHGLSLSQPIQRCFHYKKDDHVEQRFIKEIASMGLDPDQSYQITCYLTWSPCPGCAWRLVDLLGDYPNLKLHICTSRLYFHWLWDYIEGLRHLWMSNVLVSVMTRDDFARCWENFVDHQGEAFEPWEKLDSHTKCTARRLHRILKENSPAPCLQNQKLIKKVKNFPLN